MNFRQLIRKPFVTTRYAKATDLTAKHVIVTGCGLGSLGFETAKTLARWGAVVIVTTRSNTEAIVQALKDELAKENISARVDGCELDLSDAESVSRFSQWYRQHYGQRLDILINNAGIHLDLMSKWKEPKLTSDGYEMQWLTNYLGSAQLTHNLLPVLQKTGNNYGEARIVNVVSQLYSRANNIALFDPDTAYNSWKFYGLSKLALIHFSYELDRRFSKKDNLQSYCLHPGSTSGTYTNVADKGFQGSPFIAFLRKLGAPIEKLFMSTAEEGAQTQIHCATSTDAQGGHYYQNCQINETTVDTQDEKVAGRLWQETLDWVKTLPL
jgi:NAD(P)-dependent dehydrogenase (short-subunit alcohol dehydrogenase family)